VSYTAAIVFLLTKQCYWVMKELRKDDELITGRVTAGKLLSDFGEVSVAAAVGLIRALPGWAGEGARPTWSVLPSSMVCPWLVELGAYVDENYDSSRGWNWS
jgi:hypothetical protein